MDMDVDFVRHSISKRSIELFVKGLNRAVKGIDIAIAGPIADLKHEDYRGKRIFVTVADGTTPRPLRTKIDIGVHTHEEMVQLEYSFEVVSAEENAELQVNSNEQIFVEKLLSLLRHGIVSRRPKDVFDMYYLSSRLNRDVLRTYMASFIYANNRCKERSKEEVIDSLQRTFSSKRYLAKLGSARVNWIGVSPKIATSIVVECIASL